jgi:catechol 2,3-dioxygenase-like lactoylglutathione lyase family enzyme
MLRIGHIELMVADPVRSRDFYVDVLGGEVVAVQEPYIWVKLGEIEILLRPATGAAHSPQYDRTPIALVLYTNDLEDTMRKLSEKGFKFTGTDGSEKCPTFTDPDGNWFQLVNPEDI